MPDVVMQAILFYAPTLIWRAFNSKAGVDADNILAAAQQLAHANGDTRDRTVMLMTKQIDV